MVFEDAGADAMSAAKWITFSPAAVTVDSGRNYSVRVTADVPKDAKPGVYRAGIFVQERPPATPPQKGDHTILFRFRYLEVLYIIVPPTAADAKLVDASIEPAGNRLDLVCRMRNDGSGLVRPFLNWSLRDESGSVVRQEKRLEANVLLPQAKLSEHVPLGGLAPGKYELSIQVDFRDNKPVQALTRKVEISDLPEAARPASIGKQP